MNTLAFVGSLSKSGGGLSYSAAAWANSMATIGMQNVMLSIEKDGDPVCDFVDGTKIKMEWVKPLASKGPGSLFSSQLKPTVKRLVLENDLQLVHDHGVWLPVNHELVSVSRHLKIPYVITPHGMLTKWCYGNKPLKKRLAWFFYLRNDIRNAAVVHMTAESEAVEFEQLGFKGRLGVIPNGIDLPRWVDLSDEETPIKTALFVSRLHPKKGLLNLIEAWSRVRPEGWKVKLVGPDEGGYGSVIKKAISERGLEGIFSMDGPIYGEELWRIYRNADLFILPTLSENFGNVVPEALACGLPVLCTQGAPWGELNSEKCGWWFPVGVEPLVDAISKATKTSKKERNAMGRRGRRLVENKYTWRVAAGKMRELYEWTVGIGQKPKFVFDVS